MGYSYFYFVDYMYMYTLTTSFYLFSQEFYIYAAS
jgi:hypothetical protein